MTITVLPDGSAFFTASIPLPKDHWITEPSEEPKVSLADKFDPETLEFLRKTIIEAGKNAIRGATMSGKEMDFDPDALIQNLCYQLFGPTPVGVSSVDD